LIVSGTAYRLSITRPYALALRRLITYISRSMGRRLRASRAFW